MLHRFKYHHARPESYSQLHQMMSTRPCRRIWLSRVMNPPSASDRGEINSPCYRPFLRSWEQHDTVVQDMMETLGWSSNDLCRGSSRPPFPSLQQLPGQHVCFGRCEVRSFAGVEIRREGGRLLLGALVWPTASHIARSGHDPAENDRQRALGNVRQRRKWYNDTSSDSAVSGVALCGVTNACRAGLSRLSAPAY